MVRSNADPGKAQAEVAKTQLEKLGFKVRLRLVPQDAVYTDWCQVPPRRSPCRRRRLVQGLQPPAVDARPDVQGREHRQERWSNNNLAQLERTEDRRRDGQGRRARRATRATRRGAEIDKMITAAALGRAVRLGQDDDHLVQGRCNGVGSPYYDDRDILVHGSLK
jgi:peptide/nickel transport system substrate-binding protein